MEGFNPAPIQKNECPRANNVHPGRWLVHIIYPQLKQWPYHIVRKFECEDINLHGCMIQTQDRHWKNNFDLCVDPLVSNPSKSFYLQ